MTKPRSDTPPSASYIANLGPALATLASSSNDMDCLDMFARLPELGNEANQPLLLTVLIEPLAGVRSMPTFK